VLSGTEAVSVAMVFDVPREVGCKRERAVTRVRLRVVLYWVRYYGSPSEVSSPVLAAPSLFLSFWRTHKLSKTSARLQTSNFPQQHLCAPLRNSRTPFPLPSHSINQVCCELIAVSQHDDRIHWVSTEAAHLTFKPNG
jgi:hypothetical protein